MKPTRRSLLAGILALPLSFVGLRKAKAREEEPSLAVCDMCGKLARPPYSVPVFANGPQEIVNEAVRRTYFYCDCNQAPTLWVGKWSDESCLLWEPPDA